MGRSTGFILHMEIAILQFMLRAKEQVFKKHFEILARSVNTFLQIVVVGADKRVAEVPGVRGKHIVVHGEAEGLQILHDEDRGRARVSLAEGMDLPNTGRKLCHVLDRFRNRKRVIGELLFLRKIIIQRVADALPGGIDDRKQWTDTTVADWKKEVAELKASLEKEAPQVKVARDEMLKLRGIQGTLESYLEPRRERNHEQER